jgi:MFS family permease
MVARSTPRLGLGQRLSFLGCSVGIGVFSAFNNFTLTLWLSTFTSSYVLLGLLGNSRTFEGAIVSPIAGAWSDKVWLGWLGRRRPFILVGGLLSALLLALTPTLGRSPWPFRVDWLPEDVGRLAPTIATILLFTVTFNAMDDIHRALLVDIAAPQERNGLSAQAVVVEMVSQVAILIVGYLIWFDRVPDVAFAITGGLMALAILVTVLGVREPEPAAWLADRLSGEPASTPGVAALPVQEPGTSQRNLAWPLGEYRPAFVLGLVMFFYWSGVNAVLPLVSVYVRDILHGSVGEAQLLPALMLLSTMLMAIPIGWLGDRFGKRWVIGIGAAIIAGAAVSALFITTLAEGAVVFLLAGVGSAAVMVLTVPLLSDLVPRRHMGTATGVLAASGSLAAPLASLAAGSLAELYGPRAIFAMMAALVGVALALLPFTQPASAAAVKSEPKHSLTG